MKKTITTLALILALALGATAQPNGGGLFQRGYETESSHNRASSSPLLPQKHGEIDSQSANESSLAGGMSILFGFGVLYLTRKRRDD